MNWKKYVPLFVFLLLFIFSFIELTQLKVTENIDETLPFNANNDAIQSWLGKQKKSVVFSLHSVNPIDDFEQVEDLVSELNAQLDTLGLTTTLAYKSDVSVSSFSKLINTHLAVYLDSGDYEAIDQKLKPENITESLHENIKILRSPSGFGQRSRLLNDPLGFSNLAFRHFSNLNVAKDLLDNHGYYMTSDQHTLLAKSEVLFDAMNSVKNHHAVQSFDLLIDRWNEDHDDFQLAYFGVFAIAEANATQIAKDVKVTVSLAVVAIVFLLIYYYRKGVILILFMLPGVFGVMMALGAISWWQGSISGLGLAASAVIFGIVADYSFHFFTHFKLAKSAIRSRNELMFPMIVSSATTIIAFAALLFADSKALHDFGLFTSISLASTLAFLLLVIPQILARFEHQVKDFKANKLDRMVALLKVGERSPSLWFVLIVMGLTVVFFNYGSDVQFESDMRKINYYPVELQDRERDIQNIDPETEQRLTILASSGDQEQTVEINFELYQVLTQYFQSGEIKQCYSVAPLMIPKKVQKERIEVWEHFWKGRSEAFITEFDGIAVGQNWKSKYFNPFYTQLTEQPTYTDVYPFIKESNSLSELVFDEGGSHQILSSVVVNKLSVPALKIRLEEIPGVSVIDATSIVAKVIEKTKENFNYLLLYAAIAVFVVFLFIYGNIEMTLVSFIPMVISWIWLLGMAALLGIKFNFINVILATFIFGLGDDFSIFITDGLLHRYKYKKEVLSHYKTGIVLSAISTMIGTGVLIFAGHPALKSIAVLSLLGIGIIVFVTFYVQPILFRFLVINPIERGKPPYRLFNLVSSMMGFVIFAVGSLGVVLISLLIRVLPFCSLQTKKLWVHVVLQKMSGLQLDSILFIKRRRVNFEHLNFDRPAILIANHSSFYDILALVRLHPKIILMVNDWVYHSKLFGAAIRFADYVPSFNNMETQLPKIQELVDEGYSIGVFPEGRRSVDGKVGRFHKGAFYLAEELKLDIIPIILHGHGYVMSKNEFYQRNGYIDTKVLPRIRHDDPRYGVGYQERTKSISAYFKSAYKEYLAGEMGHMHTYYPLLAGFFYKSPILIWYFRAKWKHENMHYENYHTLIGTSRQKIYDLGCGYGYLSHYLSLRDPARQIVGVDYDEEKVDLAQHHYLTKTNVRFESNDVYSCEIKDADAIILADVLHYLSTDQQLQTLKHCHENLTTNGILLIRDAVTDMEEEHKWTEKSEKWSTKWVKFNKTSGDLIFFKTAFITDWGSKYGYEITIDQQASKSSNTLFVLRKRGDKEI